MNQLNHENTNFPEKRIPLVLILDNVTSPANIGSLFRLADAFNITSLVLCGKNIDLGSNRLLRTARSTVSKVDHLHIEDTVTACEEFMNRGYSLFALEITKDSKPIDQMNYEEYQKIALVVGNENAGITEEILTRTRQNLHITMYGKNSSMNVAQATGIALYEISKSLQHFQQK